MKTENKINIFVVDDSAVFRQRISHILEEEKERINIIGSAPNGKIALEKLNLPKYKVDLLIVDMIMPEMDGIELIKNIMIKDPVPIIAVSAFKNKDDIESALLRLGLEVFESGAVQFISKPNSRIIGDDERFTRQLIKTIISLAGINLIKSFTVYKSQTYLKDEEFVQEEILESKTSIIRSVENSNRIILIGASAGGPKSISFILSQLKPLSPPVVIVQHMPEAMMSIWCQRLCDLYPELSIKLAENGEKIRSNQIYIAPGGHHSSIDENRFIKLHKGEKINYVVPAIDVTFSTAVNGYRNNILGIILTGMGNDGYEGSKVIKKYGGAILAEHESTSMINSMPNAVIEGKLADRIVPLHKIPAVLRINKWF